MSINRSPSNPRADVLSSGDLDLISRLSPEDILEHFGEDSFEHLAYEQRQADVVWRKMHPLKRQYRIPGMTENPAVNYGMLQRWIADFHRLNSMDLPTGFWRRNKWQLLGMYHGMRQTYNISVEDIVGRKEY